MTFRVVHDGPQPRTQLFKTCEDVGLIEVVGEKIQSETPITDDFVKKIAKELVGFESKPLVHIAFNFGKAQAGRGIRIRDGRVTEVLAPPTVPSARELVADLKGGLARLQNGKLERYPFDPGPDGYGARQIAITPEGFVLGALGVGLMVVRDGRAQVLTLRNGLRCDSINGVVLDGSGYAWLYSECGLTSVAMSDIESGGPNPTLSSMPERSERWTVSALDGLRFKSRLDRPTVSCGSQMA